MTPHPLNIKRHFINKPAIPTKQHCLKVKQLLECKHSSSVIYVKGKSESTRDNTDVDMEFRQESNFFYLTGVDEPGFHVIIHLQKERVYLITPHIPENDIFWKGPNDNTRDLLEKYDVDEIVNESDLPHLLSMLSPQVTHVLDTTQATELTRRAPMFKSVVHTESLLPAMNEARLIKFSWEIDIMRQVTYASSQAHIALIQQFQLGMTETHLAALFRWTCALQQIYKQAYLPIVASGPRAATLHYTKNNQIIPSNTHTLVLVDAGGEKLCYASDITRTFPVHGTFSQESRVIYNIVLQMQEAVLSKLRPGVLWSDMQELAMKVLTIELVHIGILKCRHGDQLEELIQMGVPSAFYYHGLGHSVGLDIHDVGGRNVKSDEEDTFEFLCNRPLEKNMVLTVEPGLYFNEEMLDIWIQYPGYEQYFDLAMLDRYRLVGGVRIEDTVVITEDGYENLTKVPKQIHEIEALMNKTTDPL
ncbi:hypothetical protein INT47_013111 [Mucor saturninus]|uniref:Aminopeptidase P N-terminal domain-containing protein n=1 Tax=Mucor saturninus TaxID=64648 RepID=A0A8H7R256_9FUNG|nr:hypothetical protein INT47_013111 [Mucor saturninus]